MESTNDIYQSYHAMSGEISEGLSRMAGYCGQLGMEERQKALLEGKKKLQSHKFAVGILGEFKRGKSTIINALLGKEIMPADILPCSATMNRVSYDLHSSVELKMVDGTTEHIAVEELAQYVTKLDDDSAARAEKIEEAVVYYPCRFCRNGVDIVDTPGLNDDERMNKITEETVPKLDAVIMVLVADNPFSMSEAEFVRNKLMVSDIGRLIFLVNKIDLVRPRDRARVVESIRAKIQSSVLEKSKDVYGADSPQYRDMEQKLADIRIYPVSAQNALDGRMGLEEDEAENERLVAESGFPAFEEALGKLLTEERGALELGTPMSQLLRCVQESKDKIRTFIEAMDTDEDVFRQAQREMLAKQQQIRTEKEQEKRRLRELSHTVNSSLGAKTGAVYHELEEEARAIISRMSLANPKQELKDSDKQALIDATMREVDEMSQHKLSVFCERIGSEINEIVGREAIHVTNFLTKSQLEMMDVSKVFSNDPEVRTTRVVDAMGIALDVATDFIGINGLGGIISGFRAAGVKGALVGGAAGLAANLAAWNLVLVPLAAPVLPALIISCAVGTFTSKFICKKLFASSRNIKELEKLKESLQEQTAKNFAQLRSDRTLEKWVESSVTSQFDQLCTAMDSECEGSIREAEETIGKIKLDLARNASEKKAAKENYLALEQSIDALGASLEPVRLKLSHYLA